MEAPQRARATNARRLTERTRAKSTRRTSRRMMVQRKTTAEYNQTCEEEGGPEG